MKDDDGVRRVATIWAQLRSALFQVRGFSRNVAWQREFDRFGCVLQKNCAAINPDVLVHFSPDQDGERTTTTVDSTSTHRRIPYSIEHNKTGPDKTTQDTSSLINKPSRDDAITSSPERATTTSPDNANPDYALNNSPNKVCGGYKVGGGGGGDKVGGGGDKVDGGDDNINIDDEVGIAEESSKHGPDKSHIDYYSAASSAPEPSPHVAISTTQTTAMTHSGGVSHSGVVSLTQSNGGVSPSPRFPKRVPPRAAIRSSSQPRGPPIVKALKPYIMPPRAFGLDESAGWEHVAHVVPQTQRYAVRENSAREPVTQGPSSWTVSVRKPFAARVAEKRDALDTDSQQDIERPLLQLRDAETNTQQQTSQATIRRDTTDTTTRRDTSEVRRDTTTIRRDTNTDTTATTRQDKEDGWDFVFNRRGSEGSSSSMDVAPIAPQRRKRVSEAPARKRPRRITTFVAGDVSAQYKGPQTSSSSSSEDSTYIVEELREMRRDCQTGKKYYLVKWENYTEEEKTWEPLENLLGNHADEAERLDWLYNIKMRISKEVYANARYRFEPDPNSTRQRTHSVILRQFAARERIRLNRGEKLYFEEMNRWRPP